MNMITPGWYLVYTRPRHEKKVHCRLNDVNVNSFLPTRKVLRSWHDRKKYIDEPLFPSYVFIYLESLQDYYTGVDTEGVLFFVRTGRNIARLNDDVVADIKLVTERSEELEVTDFQFQPGQKLVISEGSLTGLSCEIIEYKGKEHVLVRVDLLQRSILVTMPSVQLMATP